MNLRDTLKLSRLNIMRLRRAAALKAATCQCPACVARREGREPPTAIDALQALFGPGLRLEGEDETPTPSGHKGH